MILAPPENIQKYEEMGIYNDKTLHDFLKEHVAADPEKECFVDPPNRAALNGLDPERLTYAEFDRAADATAEALIEKGLAKDDIVLVQLPNSWELAMLYFAITRAGGVMTPAPVLWRKSELGHIAALTEARLFITLESFNNFNHAEMGRELQAENPKLQDVLLLPEIREMSQGPVTGKLDNVPVDANDIFTICWTSGTEAQPKGCPLSHNNWKGMAALQDAAGFKPGDTFLTAGPLVNMASLGTAFMPWVVYGGKFVLHHPFDAQVFLQQLMTEKPNYTLLVPAIVNAIAKHPQVDNFDLSSLRCITVGSAPPSLFGMQEFKRRWDIDTGNTWGQNEGTGIISGLEDTPEMEKRVDHFPQFGKLGSQWKSTASRYVEAKIIDEDENELTAVGEVGELAYKGPGVIAGYFKNPEATKKSFTRDGFFKTGDLFQVREDNYMSFYERSKDIVIRGGYNISAQEIENYLLSYPKIKEVAIVSMPDEVLGEKMCAYVVPLDGEEIQLSDIVDFLAEKGVAKYKYPERIEQVEVLPRNPVGKVLKNELRHDILGKLSEK